MSAEFYLPSPEAEQPIVIERHYRETSKGVEVGDIVMVQHPWNEDESPRWPTRGVVEDIQKSPRGQVWLKLHEVERMVPLDRILTVQKGLSAIYA